MRPLLVLLHRYVGLFMAAFLIVTGLTGAVISWDHELDEWLNPQLLETASRGSPRDPLALAAEVAARHPEVEVLSFPLAAESGHTLAFWVEPKIDPATGKPFDPGFNQVFVDPVSGAEQGRRAWGAAWPLDRENFVSFLYKLHYSLHLPSFAGTDQWGVWLLGIVALLWTIDCFTGAILTLPAQRDGSRPSFWQRWRPSWRIRRGAGSYKLNFDLHRAGSLWTWALLFVLAFTAFSLNLYREVFFPVMTLVSDVTPSPFDLRTPTPPEQPIAARIDFADALARARREAAARRWPEPAGEIFYARNFGIYGVEFFHPEDEHGSGGVGPRMLFIDGADGSYLGDRQPWQGTVADLFVQAQFPLHSGRILGLPGRILVSLMGLVVAGLTATGVYIWWRKRDGRQRLRARQLPA
jgi:uncharacterized iron-regulated membrane protein